MLFVQTSTHPPTLAPKAYQTWKQNNQLPTRSHDELKDNSTMPISMEDLCGDLDNILMDAIALWRNSNKFRWLFSHPQ